MAVVAFFVIATVMVLAMILSGGYGRLSRELSRRRERRRRAAGDDNDVSREHRRAAGVEDDSVTVIEIAVRNGPGGNGREEEGRLSGETVVNARRG